ncbi:MAG: spermine synthase, partial [Limisphaerales bacterium]
MKPRQQLGRVTEASGACLELYEHDGAYTILCDGQVLMDSRTHASEYQMGQLAMQGWDFRTPPRILIGGL